MSARGPEFAIDTVARTLATPMSRRRSIALIAGTVLGGSALRPWRARAAGINCPPQSDPSATQKCEHPGGAAVCVTPDYHCCNSTTCAQACRPWQRCTDPGAANAGCSDTPQLCLVPREGGGPPTPRFCSQTFTTQKALCSEPHSEVRGWCCKAGETCDTQHGGCICNGTDCGNSCCGPKEYCQSSFGGDSYCLKLCPDGNKPCANGVCCTGLETCGFFGCSCKPGYVSCGTGRCCLKKDDPGDPNPGFNPIRDMLNMMGQTSAGHGGGGPRTLFARPAQTGLAGVDAALDALAAVNGQGAAAMLALRQGKRDPAFKRGVTAARVKPPGIAAGPGLDASSAAALNKLLIAEAKANALVAATAKALWRSRAAHAKHDRAQAKRQLRASAKFAGQAATALRRIQALRTGAANALTAGGVAEAFASEDAINAFIAGVRTSGLPSSLRTPLAGLGVNSADLKRLRAGVLDQTVTAATGPMLIGPLSDPGRAADLKKLTSELSKFSTRARKHPIAH